MGLLSVASAAFDRRLSPKSPRPIAVAFSGGGDSLALLIAAKAWSDAAGRRLIALHVDHGLHPQSGAWAKACASRAAGLGVAFRTLAWTGAKPATGLEAAARDARHRLLAEASRDAGARVILTGHTASDVAEARAMRAAGSSTPEPRDWAPSPAWPQGRGLFLLRPLITLTRAEIRDALAARGETWIEDPANADPRFARTRARAALDPSDAVAGVGPELPTRLARACEPTPDGGLAIDRNALRATSPELVARFTAFACLCVAGTVRPPSAQRLAERLQGDDVFAATLGGARIEAGVTEVRFLREAGERARGGLQPVSIGPGQAAVWDGRFEIAADRPLEVRALAGLAAQLAPAERKALGRLPPAARRALPAVIEAGGEIRCPILAPLAGIIAQALAHDRLLAAAGVVDREPA